MGVVMGVVSLPVDGVFMLVNMGNRLTFRNPPIGSGCGQGINKQVNKHK